MNPLFLQICSHFCFHCLKRHFMDVQGLDIRNKIWVSFRHFDDIVLLFIKTFSVSDNSIQLFIHSLVLYLFSFKLFTGVMQPHISILILRSPIWHLQIPLNFLFNNSIFVIQVIMVLSKKVFSWLKLELYIFSLLLIHWRLRTVLHVNRIESVVREILVVRLYGTNWALNRLLLNHYVIKSDQLSRSHSWTFRLDLVFMNNTVLKVIPDRDPLVLRNTLESWFVNQFIIFHIKWCVIKNNALLPNILCLLLL